MSIFNVFLVFYSINLIYGFPTDNIRSGFKPLTPEELKRFNEWTEDSKQNIWELSGQFEGDIVLSPEQKDEIVLSAQLEDDTNDTIPSSEQRNGRVGDRYRWTSTSIPYKINDDFTEEQKEHIRKTVNRFTKRTCIEFRPVKDDDDDWILVTGNQTGGCRSKVGRQGGEQTLNLQPDGCLSAGTILHEFLHALGFFHMHSDSKRHKHVSVKYRNILKGIKTKYPTALVTNYGEKYDYRSILHYSAYAFSKNNKKTIVTKKPDAIIGQRRVLSAIDVKKVNLMYNCPDFVSDVDYKEE